MPWPKCVAVCRSSTLTLPRFWGHSFPAMAASGARRSVCKLRPSSTSSRALISNCPCRHSQCKTVTSTENPASQDRYGGPRTSVFFGPQMTAGHTRRGKTLATRPPPDTGMMTVVDLSVRPGRPAAGRTAHDQPFDTAARIAASGAPKQAVRRQPDLTSGVAAAAPSAVGRPHPEVPGALLRQTRPGIALPPVRVLYRGEPFTASTLVLPIQIRAVRRGTGPVFSSRCTFFIN